MSIVTRIPNLLAHSAQSYALQRLTDPGIHWWYLPVTAGYDDADTLTEYRGSFSHTIFGPDVGPISPLWELCFSILLTALDRQGQRLGTVFRVRYGFCTRTPYPVVHSPHVDQGQEHRTALYYVMPTDGCTLPLCPRLCRRNRPYSPSWGSFGLDRISYSFSYYCVSSKRSYSRNSRNILPGSVRVRVKRDGGTCFN